MIQREYHLSIPIKEMWYRLEYWEILGYLYSSRDYYQAQIDAQEEAKLDAKIKSGKMNMVYKPKRK